MRSGFHFSGWTKFKTFTFRHWGNVKQNLYTVLLILVEGNWYNSFSEHLAIPGKTEYFNTT